jgi:hypothetical protein
MLAETARRHGHARTREEVCACHATPRLTRPPRAAARNHMLAETARRHGHARTRAKKIRACHERLPRSQAGVPVVYFALIRYANNLQNAESQGSRDMHRTKVFSSK